jgi:small-conductance mechanosensitive channel
MVNVIYIKVLIVLVGYIILLTTSGLLVKFILSRVKHEKGIKGAIATQEELVL